MNVIGIREITEDQSWRNYMSVRLGGLDRVLPPQWTCRYPGYRKNRNHYKFLIEQQVYGLWEVDLIDEIRACVWNCEQQFIAGANATVQIK
jgi:hypothetical protein